MCARVRGSPESDILMVCAQASAPGVTSAQSATPAVCLITSLRPWQLPLSSVKSSGSNASDLLHMLDGTTSSSSHIGSVCGFVAVLVVAALVPSVVLVAPVALLMALWVARCCYVQFLTAVPGLGCLGGGYGGFDGCCASDPKRDRL